MSIGSEYSIGNHGTIALFATICHNLYTGAKRKAVAIYSRYSANYAIDLPAYAVAAFSCKHLYTFAKYIRRLFPA